MADTTAEQADDLRREERHRRHIDAWARYLARMVDSMLLCTAPMFAIMFALGVLSVDHPSMGWFESIVNGPTWQITGFGIAVGGLAWLILETVLLVVVGATPGKALMGLQVRRINGRRLGLSAAFGRTALVFVAGMALFVPLLPLFTMVASYIGYKRQGSTIWDDAIGATVVRRPRSSEVWLVAIVLWLVPAIALALFERGFI